MVAEYGDSEYVTTHHMQRKYLMRAQLPPRNGWSIWIAHYKRVNWGPHWLSRPFLVLPDQLAARYPDGRATHFNSHATTQVIGELFIHVIRSPHPRLAKMFRFHLPQRQALFRIWPPNQFSITWPSGTIDDGTANYIADALKDWLMRGAVIGS